MSKHQPTIFEIGQMELDGLRERITQLERENAELKADRMDNGVPIASAKTWRAEANRQADRADALEQENKQLRAALERIASKLPSKELQEHLLSSTAKASERLAKKLRWELSQIAADALAAGK